ncbi:MAG TPA: carbon starvation CstA family protein [bacterium]|nr:carbon starvation CstA family protein [bacterium]
MLFTILLAAVLLFLLAWRFYGAFLDRQFSIDNATPTPSHADFDGIDRVPAPKPVLLGHHFSSIAGAGPIVGPIIATVAFGWLPTLLWIILGSIFIGGVHDYASLVASIRHKARSIAEIAREQMSPLAYKLFLAFIWLTLVYVLTVFTDLTATTFVEDGGVATSSLIFIALAVGFGFTLYRLKLSLLTSSLIFVPLVLLATWIGHLAPLHAAGVASFTGLGAGRFWSVALILYAFIASVTPVWILLQPRDYLSSYLLYFSVLGGFFGILFGGYTILYPAVTAWHAPGLGALFPILFITVACGACSGFHAIVASGTSSKQIDKEGDARTIGYGAMLIEGVVAVIAVATVAMLPHGASLAGQAPMAVYGQGIGNFFAVFGIPHKLGSSFGLLALSTFILTTLDTATRLGRYIFEEFFGMRGSRSRFLSTAATLLLPLIFVLVTLTDPQGNPMPVWKAIWPVFGATNQLLAGLTLLVILVWLRKTGKMSFYVAVPMLFMNIMTVWALTQLISQYGFSTVGIIAMVLFALALVLMVEAVRTLRRSI